MPWNEDGTRKKSVLYKMKGSPFQRNFGISPAKKTTKAEELAHAEKIIVKTPVSGDQQLANLKKHRPKDWETNEAYQRTLMKSKQRAKSEKEDSERT
jgi:hypothetical protein